MHESKILSRLFSAIQNGESKILDQFESDISSALSTGYLDTKQYSIKKLDDTSVEILDKINNTNFNAVVSNNEVILGTDRRFKVGSLVSWIDDNGLEQMGNVLSIDGPIVRVQHNNRVRKMKSDKLSIRKTVDRSFSKSRARMFLVDGSGKLIACGWLQSLMSLKLSNPSWKIISSYDWNRINQTSNNLKNFSESIQKAFTRQNRRYVILRKDKSIETILDVTAAKGFIANNPGYTMIKESEYNKMNQPKIEI